MHYTFLIIFSAFAFALWIVGMIAATRESEARRFEQLAQIRAALQEKRATLTSSYVGVVSRYEPMSLGAWSEHESAKQFATFLLEMSRKIAADRVEFSADLNAEWSNMASNPVTTQVEVQRIWADILPVLGSSAMGRRRGMPS